MLARPASPIKQMSGTQTTKLTLAATVSGRPSLDSKNLCADIEVSMTDHAKIVGTKTPANAPPI